MHIKGGVRSYSEKEWGAHVRAEFNRIERVKKRAMTKARDGTLIGYYKKTNRALRDQVKVMKDAAYRCDMELLIHHFLQNKEQNNDNSYFKRSTGHCHCCRFFDMDQFDLLDQRVDGRDGLARGASGAVEGRSGIEPG